MLTYRRFLLVASTYNLNQAEVPYRIYHIFLVWFQSVLHSLSDRLKNLLQILTYSAQKSTTPSDARIEGVPMWWFCTSPFPRQQMLNLSQFSAATTTSYSVAGRRPSQTKQAQPPLPDVWQGLAIAALLTVVPNKFSFSSAPQSQAQPPLLGVWQEMVVAALLVVVVRLSGLSTCPTWQQQWCKNKNEQQHRRNESRPTMSSKSNNSNELWQTCADTTSTRFSNYCVQGCPT